MRAMGWSPLAICVSGRVITRVECSERLRSGWRTGLQVMGNLLWHRSRLTRGEFSGVTSEEFAARYRERFQHEVSYHGAAAYAMSCALVTAIEAANSRDSREVAERLRTLSLDEFYTRVAFNGSNQLPMRGLLLQQFPNRTQSLVGTPGAMRDGVVAHVAFPSPTWEYDDCLVATSATASADTACSAHGACQMDGTCECEPGWSGDACSERQTSNALLIAMPMVGLFLLFVALTACRQMRAQSNLFYVDVPQARDKPAMLSLGRGCKTHLFLSHSWKSGQDQVAVLKKALLQRLFRAKIFLDVDDVSLWTPHVQKPPVHCLHLCLSLSIPTWPRAHRAPGQNARHAC